MDFENILTTARTWPFVDQWKVLKAMVDSSDKFLFVVLYRLSYLLMKESFRRTENTKKPFNLKHSNLCYQFRIFIHFQRFFWNNVLTVFCGLEKTNCAKLR